MEIVLQTTPLVKGVNLYPSGCHVPAETTNPTGKGSGVARGKITGFSDDSRRRLRMALLSMGLTVPYFQYGATLTVPWSNDWVKSNLDASLVEFRAAWHRFAVSFRRALPDCALIYRVELQQRRAPHIHAIIYTPAARADGADTPAPVRGVPGAAAVPKWLFSHVLVLWIKAVPDLHGGSLGGFARHGVKVQAIPDNGAMLRYMCDHASKSKQAQLGYEGKQWGIVNKSIMAKNPGEALHFPDEHSRVVFLRSLRRATAYHRSAPCVFGYHKMRNRRKCGVFYGNSAVVVRLHSLALGETMVKPL